MRKGEEAGGMYFILSGKASIWIQGERGRERRLSILGPGMSCGEMATLERKPRSADILAETAMELLELTVDQFEDLESSGAPVFAGLLRNLARILSRRLRDTNNELRIK